MRLERTNRYQIRRFVRGMPRMDYLAYMFVCDEDNDSICDTEMVRWITTYDEKDVVDRHLTLPVHAERRRGAAFQVCRIQQGGPDQTFLFSNWEANQSRRRNALPSVRSI